MNDILPIRTDRLTLRRFCCGDLTAFQAYRCDSELAKYQDWQPTTDDEARGFLTEQSNQVLGPEGQWLQVAVTCIDTNLLVGDIGLSVTDSTHGVVKIGFTIARVQQRHGYATEAVRGLLTKLFDNIDAIQSVIAVTDTRNTASISLLQRLGFARASTNEALFRGLPCTEHTFETTSAKWRETLAK